VTTTGTYSDHCAVHIETTVRYIQWTLAVRIVTTGGTYSDYYRHIWWPLAVRTVTTTGTYGDHWRYIQWPLPVHIVTTTDIYSDHYRYIQWPLPVHIVTTTGTYSDHYRYVQWPLPVYIVTTGGTHSDTGPVKHNKSTITQRRLSQQPPFFVAFKHISSLLRTKPWIVCQSGPRPFPVTSLPLLILEQ